MLIDHIIYAAPDLEIAVTRATQSTSHGVDGVSGGGLVGWALACENIEATREHARVEGFDPGSGATISR